MVESKWSAERLFKEQFAALYPAEALRDLARVRDEDANPAGNPALLAQLAGAATAFAKLGAEALGEPPAGDDAEGQAAVARLALDFSDASVHRLSALLTRERREAWLTARAGETSLLVKMAIHGALYVGACIVKNHGGRWLVRRPTWESKVALESAVGSAELAPFAWWLKALSDDEIGKGRLGDRYRTHVEVPTFDASALAPIAPLDRKIPRLAKARYDAFHRHLRAHVPELKDVGADFPSPERFAELAFKALDFSLVGGGRMLLVYGVNDAGVHLYWLERTGFVKGAFYPSDGLRSPTIEVTPDGERIRVVVWSAGTSFVHEMLWWGN